MFKIYSGVNVLELLYHVYALCKQVLVSCILMKTESDHFVSSLLSEHNQQLYSEFIMLLVFKIVLKSGSLNLLEHPNGLSRPVMELLYLTGI
jgi:hypothetical protein